MSRQATRGFTLVEMILALSITSMLVLVAVSMTGVMERSNRSITDRLTAEHSGQATLEYIVRELQTAKGFFMSEAKEHSIGYQRADGKYCRLLIWKGLLIRQSFDSPSFGDPPGESLPPNASIVSDGINMLDFRYTSDGVTEFVPPSVDPKMFKLIHVKFTVTHGRASVVLESGVAPLNIKGQSIDGKFVQ